MLSDDVDSVSDWISFNESVESLTFGDVYDALDWCSFIRELLRLPWLLGEVDCRSLL